MIAYVFWHIPQAATDRAAYEAELLRFHAALAAMSIGGFIGSRSFEVAGLPWVPAAHAYEDWYLLGDSGALDRLNDAAIKAQAQPPHDRLAAKALFGAGGIYRHKRGFPSDVGLHAYWFEKPIGMRYTQLFDVLARSADGGSLWQRQMVLGPGLEFCLHSRASIEMPAGIECLHVQRRPIEAAP
jgi:hypothetical protein